MKASLPLLPPARPAFVSKHLLAQADGAELPVAEGTFQKETLLQELDELSRLLSSIVNVARKSPDWPIRAVAAELAKHAGDEAVAVDSTPAATAEAPAPATEAPAPAAEASAPAAEASSAEASPAEAPAPAPAAPASAAPAAAVASDATAASDAAAATPPPKMSLSAEVENELQQLRTSKVMWQGLDEEVDALTPPWVGAKSRSPTFKVSMDSGTIMRKSFRESFANFGDILAAKEKAEQDEAEELEHVKEVAKMAFELYDKDGSGTIDKDELFLSLMELGRIAPTAASDTSKIDYLEATFQLADTNGDGSVDFDEFVSFYASTLHAVKQEDKARDAFSKYDVNGDNALEKHELFQALLDLDLVPGFDLAQKRAYLEEQFSAADVNGDGVVDFAEFVAFYTTAMDASRGSEHVMKQRKRAEQQRLQRLKRQAAYVDAGAVLAAARSRDVALVRGKWLLERAGYVMTSKERRGRTIYAWSLPEAAAAAAPAPLPCRQELEEAEPSAFIGADELKAAHMAFHATFDGIASPNKTLDGVDALPVVLVSHLWRTAAHPDPEGATLRKVAAALKEQMPTYQAWGLDDVGVFFDWTSLYQPSRPITDAQAAHFAKAKNQMCVWYAHKLTTVYLIPADGEASAELGAPSVVAAKAARELRGWPYFEEAACRLFKANPPDRPFKLPSGALTPAWPKVVDCAAKDRSEEGKREPPMSAPHFGQAVASKAVADEHDVRALSRLYRRVIEDGYAGLDRLNYARLDWDDAKLTELAATLDEVSCEHVLELDLSYNDFSSAGLDALAHAISLGALSAVKVLNLSHCTSVRSLPEVMLRELHELKVLVLDGCVGLRELPKALGSAAGLRELYVHHCHGLDDAALKALPASCEVFRDTPWVAKAGSVWTSATPVATPSGTPRAS